MYSPLHKHNYRLENSSFGVFHSWSFMNVVQKTVNEHKTKKEEKKLKSFAVICVLGEATIFKNSIQELKPRGAGEKKETGEWRRKDERSHKVSQRAMICES